MRNNATNYAETWVVFSLQKSSSSQKVDFWNVFDPHNSRRYIIICSTTMFVTLSCCSNVIVSCDTICSQCFAQDTFLYEIYRGRNALPSSNYCNRFSYVHTCVYCWIIVLGRVHLNSFEKCSGFCHRNSTTSTIYNNHGIRIKHTTRTLSLRQVYI